MKRLAITFCTLLFSITLMAQAKKHIQFMNIPLGITMDDFKSKLLDKGFINGLDEEEMIGDFWKFHKTTISLYGKEYVYKVSIKFNEIHYVPLVNDMRKKYGIPKKYDDGTEHQYYWNVPGGRIAIIDFLHKLYSIEYIDYKKVEEIERERKIKQKKSPTNDL